MGLIVCKDCNKEFSTDAKRCPHCGAKKKRPLLFWTLIILITVFVIIPAMKSNHDSSTMSSSSTPAPTNPHDAALAAVQLKYEWGKGGFGSVMLGNFTITNKSAYTIKDIEITCHNYASSGTALDSNHQTVYEIIKPGKSKILRHFNMGFIHSQAQSSNCEVTDLVVL